MRGKHKRGRPRICIVRRRVSTTAAAQTILLPTSRGTFWRIKRHLQMPRPPWSDRRLSRRGGKTRTMRRVRSTEDVNRNDAGCGGKTRRRNASHLREENASKQGPETTRSMAQAWRQAAEARSVLQSRGRRGRARARSRQRLCRYGQQPCRCAMDSSLAVVAAALPLWTAALSATGTAKDSSGLAWAG